MSFLSSRVNFLNVSSLTHCGIWCGMSVVSGTCFHGMRPTKLRDCSPGKDEIADVNLYEAIFRVLATSCLKEEVEGGGRMLAEVSGIPEGVFGARGGKSRRFAELTKTIFLLADCYRKRRIDLEAPNNFPESTRSGFPGKAGGDLPERVEGVFLKFHR